MLLNTQIQVNKGQIETLIERSGCYGLFKSKTYQVVRNLIYIREHEIIKIKK